METVLDEQFVKLGLSRFVKEDKLEVLQYRYHYHLKGRTPFESEGDITCHEFIDVVMTTESRPDYSYAVYWMAHKLQSAAFRCGTDMFFHQHGRRQLFIQHDGITRQIVLVSQMGDIGLSSSSSADAKYSDRIAINSKTFRAPRAKADWTLKADERYVVSVLRGLNIPEQFRYPHKLDGRQFNNWADNHNIPRRLVDLQIDIMEFMIAADFHAINSHQLNSK